MFFGASAGYRFSSGVLSEPTFGTKQAHFIAGIGETFGTDLTQWDDQSGNDHHATQTDPNGPTNGTGSGTKTIWDTLSGREVLGNWFQTFGYMNLPAGLSTNFRDMLVLVVGRRSNSSLHQVTNIPINVPIGFGATYMTWGVSGKFGMTGPGAPTATITGCGLTPTTPTVFGLWGSGTTSRSIFGNRLIPMTAAFPIVTASGGTLGRGTSSSFGYSHCIYEVVFLSGISDQSQVQAWVDWLQQKWHGTTKTGMLAIYGDSTAAGEPWYVTNPIIAEQLADIYPHLHIYSMAVSSTTVATAGGNHAAAQISNSATAFSSQLAAGEASHPLAKRVALIMGGTNDINSGVSAATLKTAFTSRVSEAKAAGATHVGLCTIMDSVFHDSTEDVQRGLINTEIKDLESGIGHDFVVNLHESANGGDDRFNDATANVDSVFQDGLHPSYFGSTIITQIIKAKLDEIWV